MDPISRPRPGQDDDDLIKMAEEFKKSNKSPSVQIVRCQEPENPDQSTKEEILNASSPLNFLTKNIQPTSHNLSAYKFPTKQDLKIPKLIHKKARSTPSGKRSLYAQQMGLKEKKGSDPVVNPGAASTPQPAGQKFNWEKSKILENNFESAGVFDSHSIHVENVNRLRDMDHDELVAARDEMLRELSTSQIQQLASFMEARSGKKKQEVSSAGSENPGPEGQNASKMPPISEIKSTWMQDLPEPKDFIPPKELQFKRFDFNGNEILSIDPNNYQRELHHHGDNQEIPGYTLSELLHLSQSRVLKQRTTSLITFSKIFEKVGSQNKTQDGILYNLIVEAFCEYGSWFVFRWNVDQAGPVNILAGLDCIKNFVCAEEFLGRNLVNLEDTYGKVFTFKPDLLEEESGNDKKQPDADTETETDKPDNNAETLIQSSKKKTLSPP